ncbi:MAG TPA: hypothetical protein VKR32_19100 [Puia sp.]|nr:hypothetical protein [Puia sp.]
MKKVAGIGFLLTILLSSKSDAQSDQQSAPPPRKAIGYLSFIFPIVTIQGTTTTPNFKEATTVGFPVGVNVIYSERFGFSYEFTPSIVFNHPAGKSPASKTSNLLFDPGPMFRFSHGFTIIPRLAFETSGRYGFTPVFNQIVARSKYVNYFAALSLPVRAGNSAPTSIGLNFQFGFIFN